MIKFLREVKFVSAVVIMMLSGCAHRLPPLSEPLAIQTVENWNAKDYSMLFSQIFTAPENTKMQHYITEVLNNNPDLKSMVASARAADYGISITHAEALPHVELSATGNRGKDGLTKETSNSTSVGMNGSWALDIWGKLSDDAAVAQFVSEKVKYDLQQAKRTFITRAARAWIEYSNLVSVEKDLSQLNSVLTQLLDHYRENYETGLTPYEFYLDAKNNLKRSQIRLQEIQLERVKSRQSMNVLRGHSPTEKLIIRDSKVPITLVALPDNISSASLANRHDIRAAFSEMKAMNHSARSAHKGLLPQISISGSTSKSGETLKKAFQGDLIWQLVGGLHSHCFTAVNSKPLLIKNLPKPRHPGGNTNVPC